MAVGLASPADAGRSRASGDPGKSSMQFFDLSGGQTDSTIEQQTEWPFPADVSARVINPFSDCTWDVDDHWHKYASGNLDPGASVTLQACQVAESDPIYASHYGIAAWWSNAPRPLGVQVTSGDPVDVSVCYSPQGQCVVIPGRWDSAARSNIYQGCTAVGYREGDPALVEVPGSQGGRGVVTTMSIRVANLGSRQARSVAADIQMLGWGVETVPFCDPAANPWQAIYPVRWSS